MAEKEHKEVELRSEEVQEIMGQLPAWIIRWGITILFIVVLALVIGSYFFKYPDVIQANMTLTSYHPAAQVVARTAGKINTLYVSDQEEVKEGTRLAVIENPASTDDVFYLQQRLAKGLNNPDSALALFFPVKELSLGSIQSAYAAFLRGLHDYQNYKKLDYYPQKIASVNGQIAKYKNYYENLLQQTQLVKSQYEIAGKQYERDSLLYMRKVISASEFETSKSTFLQSRYSLEGQNASLNNLKIQIGQMEENLLDLQLQQVEKESVLLQDYRTNAEQLNNEINSWTLNYLLVSPVAGKITFNKYWTANQNVTAGESIFTIVPEEKETLIGKALLPVARSGKVKTGQRVIIRFTNYPDQEFGVVNGVVSSISLVPMEDNYMVEIGLPNGLVTNYHKTLPVSQEMQAVADIVTEDLRLIERFFMPLKKIFKEGFE